MARPRTFEIDVALERIMHVFWKQGYEGASMHDIEVATGLKKQSLYRVFGNKRSMYLAALAAYEQTELAEMNKSLQARGAARKRFERIFKAALKQTNKFGDVRGCFLCNASVDQAPLDAETAVAVRDMFARVERSFSAALAASPPFDNDQRARDRLAQKIMAGYFGIRVLIKAGVPKSMLNNVKRQLLDDIGDQ